ncbi:DEAHC-like protein [Mya arenaria]|uniref:DEAHC-like protein n=1 Tax=Mya arenaria TaxID=6604 RepID=A0ABY7G1F4_MYAAR|nr:DEAHC-like protein [Mya arenaria]
MKTVKMDKGNRRISLLVMASGNDFNELAISLQNTSQSTKPDNESKDSSHKIMNNDVLNQITVDKQDFPRSLPLDKDIANINEEFGGARPKQGHLHSDRHMTLIGSSQGKPTFGYENREKQYSISENRDREASKIEQNKDTRRQPIYSKSTTLAYDNPEWRHSVSEDKSNFSDKRRPINADVTEQRSSFKSSECSRTIENTLDVGFDPVPDADEKRKSAENEEKGSCSPKANINGSTGTSKMEISKGDTQKAKYNDTCEKPIRKHGNTRKKHDKRKQTHIFVVFYDKVSNERGIRDVLYQRMGRPKWLNFVVECVDEMVGVSEGCTLVTTSFASANTAKKAVNLLHCSNRSSSSKVRGFFSKEKAIGEELTITNKREAEIRKALEELIETTEQVLDKHDAKIKHTEDEIVEIDNDLHRRKQIPINQFDNLSRKKLAELQSQREEFCKYIKAMKTKIEEIKDNDRFVNDLKEIQNALGVECRRLEAALPIYARREDILTTIRNNQVSVIIGDTGSGKSTQMVQYLYQAGFGDKGLIACTQPRKIAAISLATHVSKELASSVGQIVGYQVGMQMKKTYITKVLYMTDYLLLNECLADRSLTRYSCVIIDEAHERSIHTDLLLGLLKQCMKTRPELKVIVTSATIDPDIFVQYFGGQHNCPVLSVSGRAFPVNEIWEDGELNDSPYPNGFVEKALQKAINIHTTTDVNSGDILVFLTSAIETTRCAERFKQKCGDQNCICLPLHGRLKPEEQQQVFDQTPKGKRKVIFSTNIAETSVTIDGIKYVIDTGLAKEMRFDPKRNMSSLDVVFVSKSSANQRKGRAGRTSAGTCYRLYAQTVFSKMDESGTPEILRIHLAKGILRLLQLKVNYVDFEYVQSPSEAAMENAVDELMRIGAVDKDGITELGELIVRLPIEPRLGVMVKKGIDMGVGLESFVIATCCNQEVFFRAGSDEENKQADMKRLKFCHIGGDLLTMLSVYREWDKVNETEKGKWCKDNSVNEKSMKGVRDMVNEICTTLTRDLDVKIQHKFIEVADAESRIGKLIFECMDYNLGYYLGHEEAGYVIVNRNHRVQIHPSSALISLGLQPEWIVFYKVLKTSADFLTEITPVPEKYIEEAEGSNKIKLNRTDLANQRVKRVSTIPVGKHVFGKFVGPMHKELKSLKAKIQDVCNGSTVVIEANKRKGEIVLFTVPQYSEVALGKLHENLKPLPDQLLNERLEEALCESGLRLVIKEGGEVAEILMPDQYRACNIKENECAKYSLSEDEVRSALSQYGPLEQVWLTKEPKSKSSLFWGKVTFTNESDAKKAVTDVMKEGDRSFSLVPVTGSVNHQGFTIKLSWTRRIGKGICYVCCNTPEDVPKLLISRIQVLDRIISINKCMPSKQGSDKKKADLYITSVSLAACEEDIKEALADSLGVDNSKNRFDVIIPREDCTLRTNELGLVRTELTNMLSTLSRSDHFQLNVKEYEPKKVIATAFATYNDANVCEDVADKINAGNKCINGCKVRAMVEYKSSLHVKKSLFHLLEQEVIEKVKMYQTQCPSTTVEIRSLKSGHYSLDMKSITFQKLAKAKVSFDKLLQGEVLDRDVINDIQVLFSADGREKIKRIEKITGAIINIDGRRMQIIVQGRTDARNRAVELIRTEVLICTESNETERRLKGEDNTPGLMKALVMKYGLRLDKLKSETGLSSIALNFQHQKISLSGKDDALVKAMSIIREQKESLSNHNKTANAGILLPDCPVCLTPIDEADMCRLEYCGHAYCKTCLTTQIRVAIQNREFPVNCATENCDKGLVARDFNVQVRNSLIRASELVQASMTSFVMRHNKDYKFCPTPNCQMVYKISGIGERFDCGLCHASTCTTCHIEFHEGLTCDMYQSAKKAGDAVLKWIKEDPINRKMCPVCDQGIEKIDGCDHMECKCGTHICWKCLRYFSSSSACYGHLRTAHGSFV